MKNLKTKLQVRKHNDKLDKPEEVGIAWDSAIGLGIDYSLCWLDETSVNQDVQEEREEQQSQLTYR